jgi:hypothetical protein
MKDHLPIAVKRNGNAAWGTTSQSRLRLDLWKMRHHVSAGGKAVLRTTSQSSLRDASSPGRGAIGRPGQPCCPHRPNRAQSAGPCSHWQQLRDSDLTEGAGQASVNLERGARPFPKSKNFARPVRPPPTRQWLPYQGSWRAVGETERLYRGKRAVIVNLPERVVHHRNPHLEKYRNRLLVCQRAGLRLRWAARCQA